MMNKNKKWFLAVGVATVMTANGLAMAAVTTEKSAATSDKRPVAERDVTHNRQHKMDNSELLTLLNIDEATFHNEIKAGKSLVVIANEHGVSEQTLKDFMIKQMTKRIESGVQAGKLTSEQADKMKAGIDKRVTSMINGEAPMRRGHHPGQHKMDNSALLTLLKMDKETFQSERKAGKSLVTIASEHGVSEQALKEFMIQKMTLRIETNVKEGKITAEQAEKMKAGMEQRVTGMINGKAPMHKGHQPGHHKMDNSALLTLLNIDKETLHNERKAGKSLVAIAQEHGVSEQVLKDTMLTQMTQRIDAAVKSGKLSADKAADRKAHLEQRISDLINGKGPMHKQ